MGRVPGNTSKVYIDEFEWSSLTNSIAFTIDNPVTEVTAFADSGAEFVEGIYNVKATINSFFDATDDGFDEQMFSVIGDGAKHYVGLFPGSDASYGDVGYEMTAQTDTHDGPTEVAGAVLLNVTWQGEGGPATAADVAGCYRATVLCNGAVTGAGVVTNSNQNIVHHNADDVANVTAAANATNQATLDTLIDELKLDYNAHRVSTDYHDAADSTNVITSGNGDGTLPTALTLTNELKLDINAHRTQSGVHAPDDNRNAILLADATVLADCIALANDIKAKYNDHLPGTAAGQQFVATLRVLADDYTNIVVEIEESTTDAGYANLLTFTAAGTVTYERKATIAATKAWKQVNVTAWTGTSATILVTMGTTQGT